MRKIIAAFLIFLSLLAFSQTSNRFSDEEGVDQHSSSSNSVPEPRFEQYNDTHAAPAVNDCDGDGIPDDVDTDDCAPANPSDPVPIDDYLPLLLITAVGIIVHAGWRKRKQTA